MEYSIVVPTYNESDKITSTLTKILGFMREYSKSFEIIVVDDGSVDETSSLVASYSKVNSEVTLIENIHKGKGAAVTAGIKNASGALIYMCDADLSTPITELKKMVVWINEHGYDIVIGSREGTGSVRLNEPFYRHFMGRIFNYWIQFLALPGINDTQCGFKLFKKEVAKEVFSKLVVYKDSPGELTQAFFGAFDVEVLFIAKRKGYKIKELPVVWNYVGHGGRALFLNSLRMARDVLKVRIYSLKGAYK